MLQAWCLADRFKKARAEPVQDSHKGVKNSDVVAKSEEEHVAELEAALLDESWIKDPVVCGGAKEDSGSSSSSSS